MADDATTVTTRTSTTIDPPPNADDHDGLLPEPERKAGTPLWYMLIGSLCAILLLLAGVFAYLAWRGTIGSDALVGIFMGVLAATLGLYRRQQG